MAIISIKEIFDILAMTAAVSFIFMDFLKRPVQHNYDPLKHYRPGFDWVSFRYAALVTAPAIILHELAHKFVAIIFGLTAVFHAAYGWLAIGMILKALNTGFIFFVPGYVSISGPVAPLIHSLTAFAGPFLNLALWLGSAYALKNHIVKNGRWIPVLILTRKINMFLFIFNMLPIPGFDGFSVYSGLVRHFF